MEEAEQTELAAGYRLSRIVRGGWQLAGGHGPIEASQAVADLVAAFDEGITAFDCADIYTGVEELYGAFRREVKRTRGTEALSRIKVHTKFVPDLSLLPSVDKAAVERIIDRSLQRLGQERLDLVQFHWWDMTVPGATQAALWLKELQQAGKIHLIGGTNFNTAHAGELIAAGVPLASLQVQYSILDQRPRKQLAGFCADSGIKLLCYGSLAGGFISERWLGEPDPAHPLPNRSLTKYKLIIDDVGGWPVFQDLLAGVQNVARDHATDIATVASRYVLDQPQVAAVIVGARNRQHLASNASVSSVRLTASGRAVIDGLIARLRSVEGDVYDLERDRSGRHGSIMKYNLSNGTSSATQSSSDRAPARSAV